MKIALFSDTHGIFRAEWMDIIKDCAYLIHTGDSIPENVMKLF